jgi:predicted Zn-dependent protease with MMP-like domain
MAPALAGVGAVLRRGDRRAAAVAVLAVLALLFVVVGASRRNAGLSLPLAPTWLLGWAVIGGGTFLATLAATGVMDRDLERIVGARLARVAHLRRLELLLAQRVPPFDCDEAAFATVVEAELAALPAWIHDELRRRAVVVTVEDAREGSPTTLGLYRRDRGAVEVTLYRLPLMRVAGSRAALGAVVQETLLHEIGHVFGMDEDDLDRYAIGNNPLPDAAPIAPRPAADG